MEAKKELTQAVRRWPSTAATCSTASRSSDRIVFAPPNPKYTVEVFTDIECGYCRKLHSEIAEYNRQGIAVQYMAFPRMGLGSQDHREMISVWCASDRKQALTDAKTDTPDRRAATARARWTWNTTSASAWACPARR